MLAKSAANASGVNMSAASTHGASITTADTTGGDFLSRVRESVARLGESQPRWFYGVVADTWTEAQVSVQRTDANLGHRAGIGFFLCETTVRAHRDICELRSAGQPRAAVPTLAVEAQAIGLMGS